MNTPVLRIDLRNVDLKTKRFKEQMLKEIVAGITALMNGDGGKIELQMKTVNNKQIIRIIEQLCINIVGCQVTVSNLRIKAIQRKVVCEVTKADVFITAHYNIYLPTETQVVAVSSLESIKDKLLNRKSVQEPVPLGSHCKQFERYQSCGLDENKVVQLKLLKDSPSKFAKLVQRIKNNKLTIYVSAFANYNGGHIYYGITDDGIVIGELISNEDRGNITKEIEKALKKMIWPELTGQPKRGEHWEIFFEPVVDENSKPIPSTFVIVIYIAPCLGGVFTEEPECYEVVEGKVKKMSFATWKKRIFEHVESNCSEGHSGNRHACVPEEFIQPDKVLPTLERIIGQSVSIQEIITYADQVLTQSISNGECTDDISAVLEEQFPELIEVKLLVLSKKVMVCYRSGSFVKAQELIKEYDALLSKATDCGIFDAIRAYIETALHRARGDTEVLSEILPDALEKAELIQPGLITANIYLLAATVTSLFQPNADNEASQAQDFATYTLSKRAQEHLKHVQDSPAVRADLEQKTHITLALFHLCCNISGVLTKKHVNSKSLEKAESSVQAVIKLVEDGNPLNHYRKVQFSLVKSILSYRYSQVQVQDDRKLLFLKEAFNFSKDAETLASECHFEEMLIWARACMALCTEGLVRTHFYRLESRSRDVKNITDPKFDPKVPRAMKV